MTEIIKEDLVNYISQFISGKHKIGIANKIISLIWYIAYQHGKESCTRECCQQS